MRAALYLVMGHYSCPAVLSAACQVRAKVFQLVGGGSFALLLGSLTLVSVLQHSADCTQHLSCLHRCDSSQSTDTTAVALAQWWRRVHARQQPHVQHVAATYIITWCGLHTQDEATSGDVWALTALAGGLVAASYCLWYYSRRYVGEMALMMPDAERVRFSVLDFWGNREVRSAAGWY